MPKDLLLCCTKLHCFLLVPSRVIVMIRPPPRATLTDTLLTDTTLFRSPNTNSLQSARSSVASRRCPVSRQTPLACPRKKRGRELPAGSPARAWQTGKRPRARPPAMTTTARACCAATETTRAPSATARQRTPVLRGHSRPPPRADHRQGARRAERNHTRRDRRKDGG